MNNHHLNILAKTSADWPTKRISALWKILEEYIALSLRLDAFTFNAMARTRKTACSLTAAITLPNVKFIARTLFRKTPAPVTTTVFSVGSNKPATHPLSSSALWSLRQCASATLSDAPGAPPPRFACQSGRKMKKTVKRKMKGSKKKKKTVQVYRWLTMAH